MVRDVPFRSNVLRGCERSEFFGRFSVGEGF